MIGEIQTINIDFLSLNLSSIAPMAIAVVGALFIICLDLFSKKYDKSLYVILTVLFLLIDIKIYFYEKLSDATDNTSYRIIKYGKSNRN